MGPVVRAAFEAEIEKLGSLFPERRKLKPSVRRAMVADWGKTPNALDAVEYAMHKGVPTESLYKKASARGPGLEKIAAIWGCAMPSLGGYGGSKEKWSDRFKDTPFHKRALAIEKAEADKEISYAQQAVESAEQQMVEAKFRVKVATLESKLLNWKAEQGGEKAKVAMQEKLAMCNPCCPSPAGAWDWSDNFKNSPFYKEAIKLDAEDAHMSVERVERSIKDSMRWRGSDEDRIARAKIEAAFADWRVENLS